MSASQIGPLILYVEDEFLIQEFLRTVLLDAGFAVVVASNGAEAFDRIRQCSTDLRGMITDVNLGKGVKGWDVGRHARGILPALPVIYMSGASEHEWSREGVPQSLMIAKPFAAAHVVSAMSALIDTRAASGNG